MDPRYLLTVVPWIAVAILVIYRQFTIQPLRGRPLIVLPVILAALGISNLAQQPAMAPSAIAVLVLNVAIAVTLGLWRGSSIRVWRDAGDTVLRQATLLTLTLWLVAIVLRALTAVLGHLSGNAGSVSFGELPLFLGITFAVQNLVVWARVQPLRQAA
jgi:hypothetical protein